MKKAAKKPAAKKKAALSIPQQISLLEQQIAREGEATRGLIRNFFATPITSLNNRLELIAKTFDVRFQSIADAALALAVAAKTKLPPTP